MSKRLRYLGAFLVLMWTVYAYAGVIVHGQLVDASAENLSADPTSHTGRIYFNTTSNVLKVYNGSSWGALSVLSTPVTVPNGGTGLATLTSGAVLIGNGAGSVNATAVNSTGTNKFLTQSSSATPAWLVIAAADVPVATTSANGGVTLKSPTVQNFTSSSGTYTTPAGVLWIRVRMVGGGGAGSGSGASGGLGGNGGGGGNTTFGTTLLVANGGVGGTASGAGGSGGTASLGSGPIGIALQGGYATGSGATTITGVYVAGASGASSAFGGGGGGGAQSVTGNAGLANTGGGGGGGGAGSYNGTMYNGAGGGSGGFVDAIINGPGGTYSYAIGSGGTAGLSGTSGFTGGAGGSGYISVEEHYY